PVHARMPVEAAEEDRVQRAGPLNILRPRQHVIHLVGIFARHMPQGGAGVQGGGVGGQLCHQKRNARNCIRTMLTTSIISAVGIWARITPLRAALRSGSSSRFAGTTLKVAAMGVISVPQKPASMPMAK